MKKTASEQQRHIQQLYKKRARNDSNSITLANTLNKDIETLFKGAHKFVFELLQNADDAGELKKAVAVEFISVEDQLILRHNGKAFTPQDVEKICDNAQQRHVDKIENPHKTGYKGIGFKALFNVADCVRIVSGGYRFRFDKNYWTQESKDSPYPWPIIPIWTKWADFKPAVLEYLVDEAFTTAFILDLKKPEVMAGEFDFMESSTDWMLFFRQVHSIALMGVGKKIHIEVKASGNQRDIYHNTILKKTFLISPVFTIEIPVTMKAELQKMSDFECPLKLKTASHASVQFAAPLTSEGLPLRQQSNLLYCYLPTAVNLGLPYSVNADFLLTPDRGGLLENSWNALLLQYIAVLNFRWLAKLALNKNYRDHILKLLGKDSIPGIALFQKNYQVGFKRGKEEIPCIPAHHDAKSLLTVNECVADILGFWREFPELTDQDYPPTFLARYQLVGLAEQKCFATRFDTQELWQKLADYVCQTPDLAIHKRLLLFLHRVAPIYHSFPPRHEDSALKRISFLLCQNNAYVKPEIAYYYPDEKKATPWPKGIHLQCIDPAITNGETTLIAWLTALGVKPLTAEKIFEHEVLPRLQSDQQEIAEHLRLFEFAFQQMTQIISPSRQAELLKIMQKIRVINADKGWVLVQGGYFHDDYKPQLALMSHLKNLSQVLSPLYLTLKIKKSELRKFFKKLGTRDTLSIERFSPFTYQDALASKNKLLIEYFDSFRKYNQFAKSSDYISLLVNLPVLDLQNHGAQFVDAFWKQFIDQWSAIQADCQNITYHYVATVYAKTQRISSFLQYRLQNTPCLLASDGKLYLSTQCYRSKFKKLTALPVLDRKLPKGMAKFLGLKKELTRDDALKLLTHYGEQSRPDIVAYKELFICLLQIAGSSYFLHSFKEQLQKWSGKLPAQDNSLQTVKQLKFFDVRGMETPHSPHWLKTIPGLSQEQNQQIAELFGIPVFSTEKPFILFQNEKPDETLVKSFQPLLAALILVESREIHGDPAVLLNQSLLLLQKLQVYSVSELKISWDIDEKSKQTQRCYLSENTLYYKGTWLAKFVEITKLVMQFLQLSPKTVDAATTLIGYPLDDDDNNEPMKEWLTDNNYSYEEYLRLLKLTMIKPQSIIEPQLTEQKFPSLPIEQPTTLLSTLPLMMEPRRTTQRQPVKLEEEIDELSHSLSKTTVFRPTVQPEQIDMKSVRCTQFFPKPPSPETRIPAPRQPPQVLPDLSGDSPQPRTVKFTITGGQDTSEIGRWGENFVYQKLMADYRQKYPLCSFQETSNGFRLQGHRLQHEIKESLMLEVIWFNKAGETGASADFQIIKNGVTRYIEVKATQKAGAAEFFISGSEWRMLMSQGDRFRLFRVFNAGQPDAYLAKIKDPASKIKSGEWTPQQARFKG